jgi:protein-S-isoprenylcysteine O-methyltransferase Ste14
VSAAARLAIPALWMAWALYWGWSSRGAKRVRRRESPASRAAHVVPLTVAAALLAWPSLPGWLGERCCADGAGADALAVALVAAGLVFSAWARAVLGGNWSASVTLKEGHEIVRSGPYRLIRHPIYTGLIVALAGSALARGEWRGLLAFAIATAALWRKLQVEERWLTEEFGARYADYRRQTRALIPFIL